MSLGKIGFFSSSFAWSLKGQVKINWINKSVNIEIENYC